MLSTYPANQAHIHQAFEANSRTATASPTIDDCQSPRIPQPSWLDRRRRLRPDPNGRQPALSESIEPDNMLTNASQPQLTLPEAFGSAFVGEGFDCILGVNNELPDPSARRVTSVKLAAEMQTPSHAVGLDLNPANEEAARNGLARGASMQAICHFDLREEGNHTLAVSVSYNESFQAVGGAGAAGSAGRSEVASGGRVRSFRKLYNFSVDPCLSVRTKTSELAAPLDAGADDEKSMLDRYALEVQLENLADGIITVEKLVFDGKMPFVSRSLNWDAEHVAIPTLAPREIGQVLFRIDELPPAQAQGTRKEVTEDGRNILGALTIHWRSAFGYLGILSTGWLTSRRR